MAGNSAWHRANPEAFAQLEEQIAREFPDLRFSEHDNNLVLAGVYPLLDNGRVVDRYHIEVVVPPGGPQSGIPVVREIAERIPRTSDRHMNRDGTACLFVPESFWYEYPNGMNLLSYLKGPILGFLVGQSLTEDGRGWPWGVRPHGNAGIVDFYASFLGTSDPERVKACLEMLTSKKLKGHWHCPCGSGRSVRECHLPTLQALRARIPRTAMKASLARLQSPQGSTK